MISACGRASKDAWQQRCSPRPGNAPLVGETLPELNYITTGVLRRGGLGLFRGRLAIFLLVPGIDSGAGVSTARGRNLGKDGYMPNSPQRAIIKFLAIGTSIGMTPEQRKEYMLREIAATMQLYLDGKIDQFWHRYDGKGVIFVMTTASKEEAEILLKGLPLGVVGVLNFELLPIGPLRPINALLEAAQKASG
jgi:hypothetical protein